MDQQHYCLRWQHHRSNLQVMFTQLLDRGCFCDVTLACEGQTIRAHRVVLCACSPYFEKLLTHCYNSEKDPIIIMQNVRFDDIKCLIEFMYKGETNIEEGALMSLLKTAEELCIKGLAEVSCQARFQHAPDYYCSNDVSVSVSNSTTVTSSIVGRDCGQHTNTLDGVVGSHAITLSPPGNETKLSVLLKNYNDSSSRTSDSNDYGTFHRNKNVASSSKDACRVNISVTNNISDSDSKTNMSISSNRLLAKNVNRIAPMSEIIIEAARSRIGNAKLLLEEEDLDSIAEAPLRVSKCVQKKRGRPPLEEDNKSYQSISKPAQIQGSLATCDVYTPSMANYDGSDAGSCNSIIDRGTLDHGKATTSAFKNITDTISYSKTSSDDEMSLDHSPETSTNYESVVRMVNQDKKHKLDVPDDRSHFGQNDMIFLTPVEQDEWKDVVKMSEYLAKGRRPQFWEEPFTKRVLDGIHSKTLEMKKAAKILGVSYGTLYGRYRETYGCLKHPYKGHNPACNTRLGHLWQANGSSLGISHLIGELDREQNTPSHASEMLSTNPSAVMFYLDRQQDYSTSPMAIDQIHEDQEKLTENDKH